MAYPPKLESLCLRKVRQDILRHVVKWQSEDGEKSSNYVKLQMMYSDDLVDDMFHRNLIGENAVNKSTPALYSAYVSFIFNPYVKKIRFAQTACFEVDEEIASIIATNCKNLRSLTVMLGGFTSDFHMDFLKSLKNVVVLDLKLLFFESVPTMKTIADSLEHLRHLYLDNTQVDDDGIFVFCGHEWSPGNSVSRCSSAEICKAKSKIPLQTIKLSDSKVSCLGYACVLTHIPTLKNILSDSSRDWMILPGIIYRISMQRKALTTQGLSLQLETLTFSRSESEILETCLEACPRLRDLSLRFYGNQSDADAIGRVLHETELCNLKLVTIFCTSTDQIFTEHFKRFWVERGPQISSLQVLAPSGTKCVQADPEFLRFVLGSCVGLESLQLHLSLRSAKMGGTVLKNFLHLPGLEVLCLRLDGKTDFVNTVAGEIMLSARNLTTVRLYFEISDEILLPCMSEEILPCLKDVSFSDSSNPQAKKIKRFLLSRKRSIVISG